MWFEMIDRLREEIQKRLDELHAEAEKMRHALAALGHNTVTAPARVARAPRASVARRTPTKPPATKAPAETAAAPAPAAKTPRARQARKPATATAAASKRTAPGATKAAILAALAGGEAMTAGQVAEKAGLGRPTVSTTLTKLAKSGEVEKADRGYRLAGATTQASSS
jgi:DNA-binding transcriptional ArsR family regulator